jgi:hypothetical protein
MVKARPLYLPSAGGWIALAEQARPPLQRLDPVTRAKVLAALAGLVILGFGLVVLVWLGGRATRRYMRVSGRISKESPRSAPSDDDWARKPLVSRRGAEPVDETDQDNG